MLYTSLSCESLHKVAQFDPRGQAPPYQQQYHHHQHPIFYSDWPPVNTSRQRPHQDMFKHKKHKPGIFKKRKPATEHYGAAFERY